MDNLISVIIPTYNRKLWVQEAIDSVLRQKNVKFECIVIDDGSTDGTGEILKNKYGDRIRYYWQENRGESAARNFGASLAKGKYLAFLDSDDVWLPKKLSIQVSYLEKFPTISAAYCQSWTIDEHGNIVIKKPIGSGIRGFPISIYDVIEGGYPAIGSTLVIKSEKFKELGGFNQNLSFGEDFDFLLRTIAYGLQSAIIKKPLTLIRFHRQSQSMSLDGQKIYVVIEEHIKIYKDIFTIFNKEFESVFQKAIAREYLVLSLTFLYLGDYSKFELFQEKAHDYYSGLKFDQKFFEKCIWVTTQKINSTCSDKKAIMDWLELVTNSQIIIYQSDDVRRSILKLQMNVWLLSQGNYSAQSIFRTYSFFFKPGILNIQILLQKDYWRQLIKLTAMIVLIISKSMRNFKI